MLPRLKLRGHKMTRAGAEAAVWATRSHFLRCGAEINGAALCRRRSLQRHHTARERQSPAAQRDPFGRGGGRSRTPLPQFRLRARRRPTVLRPGALATAAANTSSRGARAPANRMPAHPALRGKIGPRYTPAFFFLLFSFGPSARAPH